jgi:hypothetical protein
LGVASPSSSFSCLASMSSAGSKHRQRWSPLAWVGPTCLQVGTAGDTWTGAGHGRGW